MSTPMGGPLPPGDEHAVSVSLPLWRDVVGWASRDPTILAQLQTGYPRFYVPHLVRRLEDAIIEWVLSRPRSVLADRLGEIKSTSCLAAKLFPNRTMANACRVYLIKGGCSNDHDDNADRIYLVALKPSGDVTIIQDDSSERAESPGNDIYAVIYPDTFDKEAKAFWQHTGYGVSSRFAQMWLDHAPFVDNKDASRTEIGDRIPTLEGEGAALKIKMRIAASYTSGKDQVAPDDVFLYQTGMTALTQTALMLQNLLQLETKGKLRVAVFGFLYVDTFKVLSKIFGFDFVLYGHASTSDLKRFRDDLESGSHYDALFTEFPGNPLLRTPDLEQIHALSRRHGFVVVVDDTIGTSTNVDLLRHCDVVCTSLTKIFSGACNVMGGSAFVSPRSEQYQLLRRGMGESYCEGYFPSDIMVMERNSVDFACRIGTASRTAERIVGVLRRHGAVQHVFYPKGSSTQHLYDRYRRNQDGHGAGYGYLLSVQFHRPADAVAFHDALDVAKGPSLGTNFTLACAYTLLAHYSELAWAAENGVAEYLVRISVGLENADELVRVVERALEATGVKKSCGCIRKLLKACSCFEYGKGQNV